MNLDRMLDALSKHAHRVLLQKHEKELTPIYHIIPEKGAHIIVACAWRDTDEKLATLEAIKMEAHEQKAKQIGFISEVWMVSYDDPKIDLSTVDPPSENPNRIECVLAIATDGNTTKSRSWKIIRNKPGGKIINLKLEDRPTDIMMTGRMIDGLIPRSIQ